MNALAFLMIAGALSLGFGARPRRIRSSEIH
jgi:hypothetical protein